MKSRRASRPWTRQEDDILRAAVNSAAASIDWHDVASRLPNRSNKDCRKRWVYSLQSSINKGPWNEDEDRRLLKGVEQHGFKWALIGPTIVGTRQPDQCSRRWHEVLNPKISHARWSAEEDEILENAVGVYGRRWTEIVERFFPNRTPIAARIRHSQLSEKGDDANGVQPGTTPGSARSRPTTSSNNASDSYDIDDSSDDEPSSTAPSTASSSVRSQGRFPAGTYVGDRLSRQRAGSAVTNPSFQTTPTHFYDSNPSFAPASLGSSYRTEDLRPGTGFDAMAHPGGYPASISNMQQFQFQASPANGAVDYAHEQTMSPVYYNLLGNDTAGMPDYDQFGQIPPMPLNAQTATPARVGNYYHTHSHTSSIDSNVSANAEAVQYPLGMPILGPELEHARQRLYQR